MYTKLLLPIEIITEYSIRPFHDLFHERRKGDSCINRYHPLGGGVGEACTAIYYDTGMELFSTKLSQPKFDYLIL